MTDQPFSMEGDDAGSLQQSMDRVAELLEEAKSSIDEEHRARVADIAAAKTAMAASERAMSKSRSALTVAVAAALLGALVSVVLAVNTQALTRDVQRQADEIVAQRTTGRVNNCEQLNLIKRSIVDRSVRERTAMVEVLANLGSTSRTPEQEAQLRTVVVPNVLAELERLTADSTAALAPADCAPAVVNATAAGTTTSVPG